MNLSEFIWKRKDYFTSNNTITILLKTNDLRIYISRYKDEAKQKGILNLQH